MTHDAAQSFVAEARRYLSSVYLPHIEECLQQLTDEQVWQRPNEQSNSIGNLLLHLAGSTRMWIVCGVGGKNVERDRQREFDERSHISRDKLMALLKESLTAADEVLETFDGSKLQQKRRVKDDEVTALEALFHAVEHFSMHTGQIILLTKIITNKDLRLH
jgi:uncharacterized damage-inducible protein DinB